MDSSSLRHGKITDTRVRPLFCTVYSPCDGVVVSISWLSRTPSECCVSSESGTRRCAPRPRARIRYLPPAVTVRSESQGSLFRPARVVGRPRRIGRRRSSRARASRGAASSHQTTPSTASSEVLTTTTSTIGSSALEVGSGVEDGQRPRQVGRRGEGGLAAVRRSRHRLSTMASTHGLTVEHLYADAVVARLGHRLHVRPRRPDSLRRVRRGVEDGGGDGGASPTRAPDRSRGSRSTLSRASSGVRRLRSPRRPVRGSRPR